MREDSAAKRGLEVKGREGRSGTKDEKVWKVKLSALVSFVREIPELKSRGGDH